MSSDSSEDERPADAETAPETDSSSADLDPIPPVPILEVRVHEDEDSVEEEEEQGGEEEGEYDSESEEREREGETETSSPTPSQSRKGDPKKSDADGESDDSDSESESGPVPPPPASSLPDPLAEFDETTLNYRLFSELPDPRYPLFRTPAAAAADTEADPSTTTTTAPSSSAFSAPVVKKEINYIPLVSPPLRRRRSPNYQRTTTYTWYCFIPHNLFHQLTKVSNLYFIFVMIVALIPTVSPIFPVTSILPVVFIIGIRALKDLIEDLARYAADRKDNGALVTIWDEENQKWIDKRKSAINVGDVILVRGGDEVPVDMVVMESTGEDGTAYVTTCNLDGETNLKKRSAVLGKRTSAVVEKELGSWTQGVEMKIEAVNDKRLDQFSGTLMRVGEDSSNQVQVPLSRSNLLLRGVALKNTAEAVGVAAYVGRNTKIARNLRKPKPKTGYLHRFMNIQLIVVLLIQQTMILICVVSSIIFRYQVEVPSFYLSRIPATTSEDSPDWLMPILRWMTFLILFEVLIPLSLFVTFEIVKTVQSRFMEAQISHFDEEEGVLKHMVAKSSDLNYDLAFIDIVFSDKTGTLTDNNMEYAMSYSHGKYFNLTDDPEAVWDTIGIDEEDELFLFLLCACVNNDVAFVAGRPDPRDMYEGASPDEVALVRGFAHRHGFLLKQRKKNYVLVEIRGQDRAFQILRTIDFNSTRKRMTVFVQEEKAGAPIWVLCKGADSQITMRSVLPENQQPYKDSVYRFSCDGYRTLMFGAKKVTEEEFAAFDEAFADAGLSENRADEEEKIADAFERGFRIVGVTAIEDELQSGVPETVDFLLKAGLRFWVLTGDKVETAVNICTTARCIDSDPAKQEKLFLTGASYNCKREHLALRLPKVLEYLRDERQKPKSDRRKLALIVDYLSLDDLVADEFQSDFIRIIRQCATVICCRVTPEQKARVTELVQRYMRLRGLAIGDGANDVSMINAAKIGVGVMGREGTQAARAADFAIPKFKYLKDLLAVQGRYSYLRTSSMVLVSFYKNLIWVAVNFIYCWFSGISGQILFDSWVYQWYNMILHLGPPFIFGLFEKDLSEDVVKKEPLLYKSLKQNPFFGIKRLFFWYGLAALQATLVFFVMYGVLGTNSLLGHYMSFDGVALSGHALLSALMIVMYCTYAVDLKTWSILMPLVLFASFAVFVGWSVLDSFFPDFLGITTFYYIGLIVLDKQRFFLFVLFGVVVGVAPAFLIRFISQELAPSDWQRILKMKRKKGIRVQDMSEIELVEFEKRFTKAKSGFLSRKHLRRILSRTGRKSAGFGDEQHRASGFPSSSDDELVSPSAIEVICVEDIEESPSTPSSSTAPESDLPVVEED